MRPPGGDAGGPGPARGLALGLVLAVAVSAPAVAASKKLDRGESYGDLAEEVYGRPGLGRLLALHNGRDPAAPPEAGTRLQLPKAKVMRLMIPQRFDDLAFRHLGEERLAPLLAAINGRHQEDHPGFRDRVVLPALLEYRPRPGESAADVARLFYGEDGAAWPIELANGSRPEVIRVPVIDFFREKLGPEEERLIDAARRRMRGPRPGPGPRREPAIAGSRPDAEPGPVPRPSPAPAVQTAAPGPERRPEVRADPAATRPEPANEPEGPPEVRAGPAGTRPEPQETAAAPEPAPRAERAPARSPPPAVRPAGAAERPPRRPTPPPPPSVELFRPADTLGGPIPFPPLERARRDYEGGSYHRARAAVASLLAGDAVPAALRPRAWLLLGLTQVARAEEAEAVQAFREARRLDPAMELDPFFYPPKVRALFDRAGEAG